MSRFSSLEPIKSRDAAQPQAGLVEPSPAAEPAGASVASDGPMPGKVTSRVSTLERDSGAPMMPSAGPSTSAPGSEPSAAPRVRAVERGTTSGRTGSLQQDVAIIPPLPETDAPQVLADADAAYYSGRWDDALRDYSRVLQLDSTLVRPWVGQVYALLRKGQAAEAMTWVNRALERFPDDPSLLSVRGVVFARQGMDQRAMGSSDYAIGMGSTCEAWLARGEIMLMAGNPNADACFQKAIEYDPKSVRTLMHTAQAYLDHRKWGPAHGYLRRVVELNPAHAYAWEKLAESAEHLRSYDEARHAYERAVQLRPGDRHLRERLDRLMSEGPVARFLRFLRGG